MAILSGTYDFFSFSLFWTFKFGAVSVNFMSEDKNLYRQLLSSIIGLCRAPDKKGNFVS